MEISQEQFQQLVVDPRTALHIRERQPKPWTERLSGAVHPFATKVRENLPNALNFAKEQGINSVFGLATGSVARIALAGTGVGWVAAIGGGMVAGATVEAFREHRSSGSIDLKKVGRAAVTGGVSGAVGFGILELLNQTGIGSAVGSVVSEKFSDLGSNIRSLLSALTGENLTKDSGFLAGISLPEVGNPVTWAQERLQEASVLLPHQAVEPQLITQPDIQAEQVFNTPQVVADQPLSADVSPSLDKSFEVTDYTFKEADKLFGDHSSLLGAADYDAARDILLTHQQIDLDLVKDGGIALIDGEELNRFELYNWVVDNYQVDHDQMTRDFMGVMRQATASSYSYDFLVPTEDGKDFLVPHFTADGHKFILKRIATGVAGRFFG